MRLNYIMFTSYTYMDALSLVEPDFTTQVYEPISDPVRFVICRSPLDKIVYLSCVVEFMVLFSASNQYKSGISSPINLDGRVAVLLTWTNWKEHEK